LRELARLGLLTHFTQVLFPIIVFDNFSLILGLALSYIGTFVPQFQDIFPYPVGPGARKIFSASPPIGGGARKKGGESR
jgi:hypothetical protein